MWEVAAAGAISNLDLPRIVLAIGGLGTAAYGLVDCASRKSAKV
jgi:hypothetical protein